MKLLVAAGIAVAIYLQTIPLPVYLPLIRQDPTPTATITPTPLPTATPTATPTLHPLNPAPELVALRPYDAPAGYSIEIDAPDAEDPALQYVGGWDSWYIGDVVGFGSWVRKYWTPAAALSGYQRMTSGTFTNDFYTGCMTGTRSVPAVAGAAAYTAIHCYKNTYNRTIYFVTYDNIVLRFEFAAPYRVTTVALACEKLMAQRALGQTEDFTCRTLLNSAQ